MASRESILSKDLLNEGQSSSLYQLLDEYVPTSVRVRKNTARTWIYGYDEKYDMVVISKTGQIGDIVRISGLVIALPAVPDQIYQRDT